MHKLAVSPLRSGCTSNMALFTEHSAPVKSLKASEGF